MQIFSHNTMTYHSPKQWYLKPLFWIGKCQSKNYKEQFENGAKCFDLRIRFDSGHLEFSHGAFRYNGDNFWEIVEFIQKYDILLRLTLEGSPTDINIFRFQCLCRKLEDMKLSIFGCYVREDNWRIVYESKTSLPEMVEAYSSKDNCKWNDIFPWLWSKIHNKKIKEEYSNTDKNVMIDFI